ncbi:GNAT family N-acetyltransferase [soil metagenome]
MNDTSLNIEHVPGRFQARVENQLCVADYQLRDNVMHMTHTGVPPALEGRGIAAKLVAAAFEHAREKGLKINPLCSYVAVYMRRHPETASLHA